MTAQTQEELLAAHLEEQKINVCFLSLSHLHSFFHFPLFFWLVFFLIAMPVEQIFLGYIPLMVVLGSID